MAGGVFSGAKLNGMTIRESATDGSDFTNPDADYRRLFLGEDGVLHLKDSAGTVTDIGGGSGDIATDAIWDAAGDLAVGSGANTAARLAKGSAGGALSMINSAVAWNSGTSFPGTAATGDRYWRTDLAMEFYYDGTRWLCTCPHWLPLQEVSNVSATGSGNQQRVPDALGQLWIEALECTTLVLSLNTGSAYWSVKVSYKNTANSESDLAGASFSTGTTPDTNANWVSHDLTIAAALATTAQHLYFNYTKTSTPNNLYIAGMLRYRIIGT